MHNKHAEILAFVQHAKSRTPALVVRDYWSDDPSAIGMVNPALRRRLAYVRVTSGRFFYELESGDIEAGEYRVVGSKNDVSFDACLTEVVAFLQASST